MNACAYNLSWGRIWQLARNWKTSKHPHVFEDEDGLHIHSFFFFEDAEDHAGTPPWHLPFATVACLPCASANCQTFRLCRMRARSERWWTAMLTNLLLDLFPKPKLGSWRMRLKTSTAIWKN